jgi:hypothetical protein
MSKPCIRVGPIDDVLIEEAGANALVWMRKMQSEAERCMRGYLTDWADMGAYYGDEIRGSVIDLLGGNVTGEPIYDAPITRLD